MDTDILVVGAGPTGLMLANQLARRGLAPLIIDRHAGPARETRQTLGSAASPTTQIPPAPVVMPPRPFRTVPDVLGRWHGMTTVRAIVIPLVPTSSR